MTTKKVTPGAAAPQPDAELQAFAHHLYEVLRISRTHPLLPSWLYNMIGEAWTEFENRNAHQAEFCERPEHILAALVYSTG